MKMRARAALLLVVIVSAACVATLAATPDSEIVAILKQANPQIVDVRVWRRADVGQDLDLVLAMGTTNPRWRFQRPGHPWEEAWGPSRPLSLLLQHRSNPGRVYIVGTSVGPDDCNAHVARIGTTDLVLVCRREKSEFGPAYKFVFDPRAKRLVSQFTYEPFVSYELRRPLEHGALIRARSLDRTVDLAFTAGPTPSFTIRGVERRSSRDSYFTQPPAAGPELATPFGRAGSFSLVELASGAVAGCDENRIAIQERVAGTKHREYRQPQSDCGGIGPTQIDGNRLWFGRTYYAGEGSEGVGGFGYFDTTTRRFQVWSPTTLKKWSVSAIHAAGDSVWLGLMNRGEYGESTAGIVRFSRDGHLLRRYETPRSIAYRFITIDNIEYALTDTGMLRLDDTGVHGFMVDQTSDGRLRVVESQP